MRERDDERVAVRADPEPGGGGTLREWLAVYLKGVFMGTADAIPGVSGGTIALITGIYERLVSAIAALDPWLVRSLPRLGDPDERAAVRKALAAMDLGFLVVLGLGVVTAVVTVSQVLAVGLETYRALLNAFFFGLIGASAIVLYGEVEIDTPRRWIAAIGGAAGAFLLSGATAGGELPHGLPVVFAAGIVTSSAMLLPGISGAALLYLLGQYEYMVDSLGAFTDALAAVVGGAATAPVVASGTVVVAFLGGVGIGLLTVAHAVRWALARDRATTLTVLVSLMVGALRLPVEEVLAHTARWTPSVTVTTIAVAAAGAAAVLALDRYTDDLEY